MDGIRYNLTLDASGFQATAVRAGQTLRQLAGEFNSTAIGAARADVAIHKMGSSFRSTIVTLGALRFAMMDLDDFLLSFPKAVAGTVGEFQRLTAMMEGLSKASTDAARQMEALRDVGSVITFAKNAPFEVKALSEAFVKLKAAGIDPMTGGMTALVNSVAKFGGSNESLTRAAVAIQQMAGKGVISMEELRQQLGEAVPNAMQMMAAGMGLSMAELVKQVSKGTVEARTAMTKMFAMMEIDAAGASKRMMETLPGAISRLKTEWMLFQKVVGDQGMVSAIGGAIADINSFLGSDQGKGFAVSIGQALRSATEQLILFGKLIAENLETVKALGIALISAYGGSKLMGAFESIRGKITADREARELVAENTRKQIQGEIDALRAKNVEHAKAMASNLQFAAQEAAAAKQAADAKIASWERVRNSQKIALDEEVKNLARVTAARDQAAKAALRADLNAEAVRVNPYDPALNTRKDGWAPMREEAIKIAELSKQHDEYVKKAQASVDSRMRLIDGANNHISALRSETIASSGYAQAAQAVAASHQDAIKAGNAQIQTLNNLRDATTAVGSAFGSFVKSIALSIASAAAFYLVIEGLSFIYNKLTESAREAASAVERERRARLNQGTDADLADDTKKLKELQKTREEIQKQLEEGATVRNGKSLIKVPYSEAEKQALTDQLDGIVAEVAVYQSRIDKNTQDLARKAASTASNIALDNLRNAGQDAVQGSDLKKRADELAEKIRIADEAGNKKLAQSLREQNAKLGAEGIRLKLKALDDGAAAELQKLDLTGDARVRAERAINEGISNERNKLRAELAVFEGNNKFVKSDKDGAGAGKSPYEMFIAEQEKRIAELKNKTTRVSDGYLTSAEILKGATDKVDAMMKGGLTNNKGQPLSAAQRQNTINLVAEGDRLEESKKITDEIMRFQKNSEVALTGIDEAFSDIQTVKKPDSVLALVKLFKDIAASANVVGPELDKLGISLESFKNTAAQNVGLKLLMDGMTKAKGEIAKLDEELAAFTMNDRERTRKAYEDKVALIQAELNAEMDALMMSGQWSEQTIAYVQARYAKAVELITKQSELAAFKMMSPAQRLAMEWGKAFDALELASTNWANSFVDQLVEGKLKFGEFTLSIMKDIAKIKIKQTLSTTIADTLGSAVGGISSFLGISNAAVKAPTTATIDPVTGAMLVRVVGGTLGEGTSAVAGAAGGGDSIFVKIGNLFQSMFASMQNMLLSMSGSSGSFLSTAGSFIGSLFGFADGGIMTQFGSVPLRKYAAGGVANSPQLAMFGEGSLPEAYVPLPDGRRIPVAMSGASSGGRGGSANVSFNVINQTNQQVTARETGRKFDGRSMILDVVLEAVSSPGAFRDNMKGAMGN
jgi:tape measure domain-containing protein